jgi:hypothetical protein
MKIFYVTLKCTGYCLEIRQDVGNKKKYDNEVWHFNLYYKVPKWVKCEITKKREYNNIRMW